MAENLISKIIKGRAHMVVVGNYPAVVQSILDFDFLVGKKTPSVLAIVITNRKAQKYFFGNKEILIPCFSSAHVLPEAIKKQTSWMLNVQSGRRVYESVLAFFEAIPHALGGHIFAENVPESHAQELMARLGRYTLVGPSGVGLLVPGHLKLGAIGGIDLAQIEAGKLATHGTIAVVSTSGGMTNELIRAVVDADRRVSFAVAVGGDRFPTLSLTDVFLLAEADPKTEAVVYFGELGGTDEYEIIELIKAEHFTKPLVAYIAGTIDESFTDRVQFGHAKALAQQANESARAKRKALRAHDVTAPDTFLSFLKSLRKLPVRRFTDPELNTQALVQRKSSILSTRKLLDVDVLPTYVRNKKITVAQNIFVATALEALLGKKISSPITKQFTEAVFALLIDHGGHVSGAVNTMITARAGKDMVSSLASGLLTIGPRFGGAVNQAARLWLEGVQGTLSPREFVEHITKSGELILGIGHKKYRVGLPDPRVASLAEFVTLLKAHPHYDFARAVERVTTAKSGSLILNVDGVVAALLLDILLECEHYSCQKLQELVAIEFFNAFFIIPRSIGFIGHFMEQKRNDEGLFRLPDELLFESE